MALNALTLTVTSGVQGRRFKSAVSGLTAGTVVDILPGSSPGFGFSNGFLSNEGLPYDSNLAIVRERVPTTGETRDTNLLITAVGSYAIAQQAAGITANGRSRIAPVAQGDGSLAWFVYVESPTTGATSSAAIGSSVVTLNTLTLSGSLQIGTAASGTIIGASAGSTIVGNIPGITVNSGARTYSGTPTGSATTISNGLVETLAGAVGSPLSSPITVAAAAVTLGTLTLSGSLQIGTAAAGTIIGATAGSTITGNIPGITINSGARTYSGTPTGSAATIANGLTETLAGATNTPHDSSITVAAASAGPLTTLPRQVAVIADFDPDTIAQADGTEVTSFTDSVGGLVATTPVGEGPTLKTNISNGHAVLRTTVNSKHLDIGRPAALVTPMSDPTAWSVMIVFKNPTGSVSTYGVLLGDILTKISSAGISLGAVAAGVRTAGAGADKIWSTSDPSTNVHTLIYSGDAGSGAAGGFIGRMFLDGTMYRGFFPQKISPNPDSLIIGNGRNSTGGTDHTRGFIGDILRIIIWGEGISAPEAWQADAFARTTYGKALATVGLTNFIVFDGDSQTQGTGASPDTSMPVLVANTLGLPMGGFANVGKPSCLVASGSGGGNNMIDSAARDVDGFHTVTGLPVTVVFGEWYNQGGGGGIAANGIALADNNRTYASLRLTAQPTSTLIGWTSLASGLRQGASRDAFNASLVSTPGVCSAIIPVHTSTDIGVDGALGTSGSPNTAVTNDAIHLNSSGTPFHAALVAPYLHL